MAISIRLRLTWGALVLGALLSLGLGAGALDAPAARAATQGEAIVAAAASMAGKTYCWDGGNEHGPTHGAGDWAGEAPDCTSPSTVGFDCTGLTQYAAYQGTGGAVDLTHHNSEQAKYAPGEWITSEAALQPGDIVYFGSSRDDVVHAAIYAGVVGGQQMIWDANTAFWIYPDGVHERTLASENSLHFVGAARVWSGGSSIGEGSYVQVAGHSEVFKIVGGAPLYVSNWSAVGGPKPVTAISQQQFDSLRPYPADGTLVSTSNDGRVYVIAGGAPLYVSNWSAIGGPKPSIAIDGWDVANPGNPAAHLRQYPADGTLINTSNDGRVYEIAGGAPLYVSNWSAIGGPKPSIAIDGWDVANPGNPAAHLRPYPADGTLVSTSNDGRVYVIAGGAPLYVSSWSAIGGSRPSVTVDAWDVANATSPYAHLRPYPADGTFLNSSTGRVYRVAGGAPIPVSTWSVFGGVQPYTTVDQWDMDNEANPVAHLRSAPLDGTVVEGLPSHAFWVFGGGLRSPSPASSTAVAVDDAGLAGFPVAETSSEAPPPAVVTATPEAPSEGGSTLARRKRRRACRKHRRGRRSHCAKSRSRHRHRHRHKHRHRRHTGRGGGAGHTRQSGSRG